MGRKKPSSVPRPHHQKKDEAKAGVVGKVGATSSKKDQPQHQRQADMTVESISTSKSALQSVVPIRKQWAGAGWTTGLG